MLAEGVDVDEGMDVDEGSSKTYFDEVKTYIETRLCMVTTAMASIKLKQS